METVTVRGIKLHLPFSIGSKGSKLCDLPCQFRSEPLVQDYLEKQAVVLFPSPFRLYLSPQSMFTLCWLLLRGRKKQKPGNPSIAGAAFA